MNWQVAIRGEGNTSISVMTMGTGNLDDHFADLAKVYLAPELLGAHTESGPRADVFSLGAIAYHLFTGKPPADNPLDLPEKLRTGDGLRLSEAIDGVGAGLEDSILDGAPRLTWRNASGQHPSSSRTWRWQKPRTGPHPQQLPMSIRASLSPTIRLMAASWWRGAWAAAALRMSFWSGARRNGQRLVLKVAIDETHGYRLRAEAEFIASLHYQNIVHVVDTIKVSGRTGMLMEWAVEQTRQPLSVARHRFLSI